MICREAELFRHAVTSRSRNRRPPYAAQHDRTASRGPVVLLARLHHVAHPLASPRAAKFHCQTLTARV